MKVALTDTTYTSDGYLARLIERLLSAGHEVHVFCRDWDEEPDARAHLHRVPDRWKTIEFMSAWSFDRWLRRKVQPAEFDVVHGLSSSSQQDITSARSAPLLDEEEVRSEASEGKKTKRDPNGLHRRQLLAIEERRFAKGSFQKVVAHSKASARRLRERFGLSQDDVVTIYNGVDLELFHPRNRETYRDEYRERIVIPKDSFVVLCMGHGFRRKGIPTLIETTRLIKERGGLPGGRELKVAIVGHDTQQNEQRLAEEAKAKGVWTQIKFYGDQHLPERWLGIPDLFALPSYYQPFGDVVLEAMATGIPPLVSCEVGAGEVIEEGENGFLLHDPHDAEALADRIVTLAGDPERLAKLSAAARETAEAYSWDRHFEELLALYEQVAALKKQRLAPA